MSHLNPIQTLSPHFGTTQLKLLIRLKVISGSHILRLDSRMHLCSPHACFMSRPLHRPWLYYRDNIGMVKNMQYEPPRYTFIYPYRPTQKLKLSLYLIKHRAMKTCREWRYCSMHFYPRH
jgi:hypothetical protein